MMISNKIIILLTDVILDSIGQVFFTASQE